MKFSLFLLIGVVSVHSHIVAQDRSFGENQSRSAKDSTIVDLSEHVDETTTIIHLTNFEGWKFNPGHHPDWANTDFDDTGWYQLSPHPDSILAVKDSLWNGHGWWRFTFRADSSLYESSWNLHFDEIGAAEIYLDGKKIKSYGNPALSSEYESIPRVLPFFYPAVDIIPAEKHVLAIRYSFHDYDKLKALSYSGNLHIGPSVHLHESAQSISSYSSLLIEGLAYLGAVVILFLIMVLHLIFYFRFPDEKSNLWIFLLTFNLLLIAVVLIQIRILNVTGSLMLMMEYVLSFAYFQFCSMIPLTLSTILQTEKTKIWKYLAVSGIVLAFVHLLMTRSSATLFEMYATLFPLIVTGLVLAAGFFIIWEAKRLKRRNIWIISTGVLSLPVIVLISLAVSIYMMFGLEETWDGFNTFITTMLVISFIALPLCMSIYVGNMFFDLYGDLESSVTERTRELNLKNEKLKTANEQIQHQRDEIAAARDNLQEALDSLKSAQGQLIQQEKLASLGQLTAGIAHEIKNPLNFVNNFSDLSLELVEEVVEEVRNAGEDVQKGEIPAILADIKANLKKIYEHGSRADGIVKSMLQHSRGGSGEMAPTDLNGLVEEYVNLAFHGMRASSNPFNVDIELDLDEKVGEVMLVKEDFSRVILNLCNNAFDAMREKLESEVEISGNDAEKNGYTPKLSVRTRRENEEVTLEIEDNGPGIPDETKNKILQPFFTTKEGTQGTGLGLSITNDIIKAHGGTIQFNSEMNIGTSFTITIPTT